MYDCLAVSDHRKLLGSVDAVSIAVPTISHYRIAKDFLEAGIDILLEKPITTTIAEADELIAIAEAKRLIFQIGLLERFNPAIVALGKVIGKPLFIETHRLHPFFERGTDVDVILDLMIHDLDIILHFVKSPIKNVEAVGVSILSDKVDIANARITFASGCVANVTASRVTGKTMQKIRFFGLEGYHAVDYGERELVSLCRKNCAGGKVEISANPVEVKILDPLEEEIRSFIESVISRNPPPVTGKAGRDSLELALLIVEKVRLSQELLP
jgi:predicted dehydrogenase